MTRTRFAVSALALFALGGLAGCQHVGNDWTQDASKTADKTASNARAGMVDKNGNWSASGPQVAGSTSIDKKGISRNNGGAADSLFYTDGNSLAIASNADLNIEDSQFYATDGTMLASIGKLSRGNSEATRASNEALDRIKDIVATLTPAQLEAAKAQAALGSDIAKAVVSIAEIVRPGVKITTANGTTSPPPTVDEQLAKLKAINQQATDNELQKLKAAAPSK